MDTTSGSGSESIIPVADLNETAVLRMALENASIENVLKIEDCPEVTNEQYEFSSSFSLATEGKLSHSSRMKVIFWSMAPTSTGLGQGDQNFLGEYSISEVPEVNGPSLAHEKLILQ